MLKSANTSSQVATHSFHYQEELKDLYRERKDIASGEKVVIVLNKFRIDEEAPIDLFVVDPEDEQRQIKGLQQLRETKNTALAKEKLAQLAEMTDKKTRDDKVNIMPAMREAVRAYATCGEIHDVLRKAFGVYKPAQS
ncbi:MAG: methylmalonyl-CoA mutase family protein [Chloroflexota bacterium]